MPWVRHYSKLLLHIWESNITWQWIKPYSQDLRERIVQALEVPEESQAEIAAQFAVSLPLCREAVAALAHHRQLCSAAPWGWTPA
jgi:transposase-like protein